MHKVPSAELNARVAILQRQLTSAGIDGALLCQSADLFYYTGSTQTGFLFVPAQGEPRFYVKRSWLRAEQETDLVVKPLKSVKQLATLITEAAGRTPLVLGLEYDVLPVANWLVLKQIFADTQLVDISQTIRLQRAVKSRWEIERLEAGCQLLSRLFQKAERILRLGITELELARELEYEARRLGHEGLVRMRGFNQAIFMGQAMAGANAAAASSFDGPAGGKGISLSYPLGSSCDRIQSNQPILVDFSAVIEGYTADMTRIFCLGNLPEELSNAHRLAVQILEATLAAAKPGVSWQSLYDLSSQLAEKAGLGEHFMGFGADKVKFVGHGVGIELDEYPVLAKGFPTQVLEEGMVFALEPKFVFPGKGVVGVEDTCLVTKESAKPLTFVDRGIIYVKE